MMRFQQIISFFFPHVTPEKSDEYLKAIPGWLHCRIPFLKSTKTQATYSLESLESYMPRICWQSSSSSGMPSIDGVEMIPKEAREMLTFLKSKEAKKKLEMFQSPKEKGLYLVKDNALFNNENFSGRRMA